MNALGLRCLLALITGFMACHLNAQAPEANRGLGSSWQNVSNCVPVQGEQIQSLEIYLPCCVRPGIEFAQVNTSLSQ